MYFRSFSVTADFYFTFWVSVGSEKKKDQYFPTLWIC